MLGFMTTNVKIIKSNESSGIYKANCFSLPVCDNDVHCTVEGENQNKLDLVYITNTNKFNATIRYSIFQNDISTNKNANSVDLKRPSTAPQKYKISKNKKTNILGIQKMMPNTYSNGFYSKQQQQYNNKRLPSPMVSGNQKFGFQKLKLKNYKTPNTTLNLNFFDKKGF